MSSSYYDSGFKSFQEGKRISTNPYVKGPRPYAIDNPWFQWRRGFFNAREELYDAISLLENTIRIDMQSYYNLKRKASGNSDGVQG